MKGKLFFELFSFSKFGIILWDYDHSITKCRYNFKNRVNNDFQIG